MQVLPSIRQELLQVRRVAPPLWKSASLAWGWSQGRIATSACVMPGSAQLVRDLATWRAANHAGSLLVTGLRSMTSPQPKFAGDL